MTDLMLKSHLVKGAEQRRDPVACGASPFIGAGERRVAADCRGSAPFYREARGGVNNMVTWWPVTASDESRQNRMMGYD